MAGPISMDVTIDAKPLKFAGANPLLTMEDASEYLAISKAHLYTLVRTRKIPFVKVGRLNRFRTKEIDAWLEVVPARS